MSIKIERLEKIYKSGQIEVHALRGINLEIKDGEFLSIAGPSGSGKTTLLNLIGCIDDPTKGTIYINGKDVSKLNNKKLADFRNQNLGFVFQTFNLIPVLTAFENVEFALILKNGHKTKENREAVETILERVGLKEYMNQKPLKLSGGQQQRVAIARALVKNPKLVLADEPTANLDSETAADILMLMENLNREEGVTFVFSTHDRMVMDFAKRLLIIKDGLITSDKSSKK
jgi:putative ABC transport system ATP-binding protein